MFSLPSLPLLHPRRVLPALLSAVLLCASGLAAAEPVRVVLDDLDRHGYASPLLGIQRLQAAEDRPDAGAPVAQQLRYHVTLAQLAVHGEHKPELASALKQLERLAESGRCTPCGSYLLALRIGQADLANQRAAIQPLLDRLAALPPSSDLRFEALRLGALSRARMLLGEDAAALSLGLQAVETAERARLPASEARLLNALASVHFARDDMASALRVVDDSYAIAERIGFRFAMAQAGINRSYAYGTLKQPAREFQALLDVLRITKDTPGAEALEQIAHSNLSAYHIHRGEYAQAIAATQEAERLARQVGDDIGLAFALSNRGSALARSGRVDEGIALMRQGMAVAEKAGGRREVVDLLSEQANVLERAGRHRDALAALRRVVELSGAITSAEREKAVLELQEKFSAERKNREIERLSLQNARAQAEVAAHAWRQRLWVALALVLLLSAVLLVLWLREARRRNRALLVDNAALASQSVHDPLTGVFNRRHFEQLMAQQEATVHGRSRDRHYQAAVGLLLLDVDFFKRINDTWGHAAGDAVLKEVAARLSALVREQDAVVRWGGEEFVLVLPGTSPEGLPVIAAKALSALGREPVIHEGREIPVRASAGAIAWPAWPGQDWMDAVHVADLALYLSKSGGRNRATCFMGVREGMDPGRVHGDLAGAAAAGEVDLQVVPGWSAE
ncbi:diguanylate cyclase [Massilia sp. AB1]|uniref:diguanylate cyclase n=1 Tax=Massilia sp. AB1 TaxID=2823371 RepID=UPI001B813B29|nr:diguanylate cyclase [Massilia sp. AB1]MBQ5941829.1 diguanylate cyclase [Massilia sp. AB1]